jgi:hypothetical protein
MDKTKQNIVIIGPSGSGKKQVLRSPYIGADEFNKLKLNLPDFKELAQNFTIISDDETPPAYLYTTEDYPKYLMYTDNANIANQMNKIY